MEAKFQSSFIPKNPVVNSILPRSKPNPLGALSSLIFVLALLSLGGLFAYKKFIERSIAGFQNDLVVAEAAVDRKEIDMLVDFDKRLKALRSILASHVAVSEYLTFLEEYTVSALSFSSLHYTTSDTQGPIEVRLSGRAPSYAAIAQQAAVLAARPEVLSTDFGGFALNESGDVQFELSAQFAHETVRWSNLFSEITVSPALISTSTASTTASTTNQQ